MDFTHIRFWPFMADGFVEVALRGVQHIAGHTVYAARYVRTGEGVISSSIDPNQIDQTIRDLYGYEAGAWTVHQYRMKLQVYFGLPPIAEAIAQEGVSNNISEEDLEEMVCHEGQWYANEDTLKQALEDAAYHAEKELWAVPKRMLEPPPGKVKRRAKRRWII